MKPYHQTATQTFYHGDVLHKLLLCCPGIVQCPHCGVQAFPFMQHSFGDHRLLEYHLHTPPVTLGSLPNLRPWLFFGSSQFQQQTSLSAFYSQVRKEGQGNRRRLLVSHCPRMQRPPILSGRFLHPPVPAEG